MLLALFVASCRAPGRLTQTASSADSLLDVKRFVLLHQQPVPPSVARTAFPARMLSSIPIGTGFGNRSGQAVLSVRRISADSVEVTATCDSLARQVMVLTEELTRIRSQTSARVEEPPPRVVHQPTGWQWFQIWAGRIALSAIVLMLLKRYLKHRAAQS